MMSEDPDTRDGSFASPPCFMHELDAATSADDGHDGQAAIDVARWRRSQRKDLIGARMATAAESRSRAAQRIAARLDVEIGEMRGRCVGIYWPFRAEPDLRAWAATVVERGGRLALPAVVEKTRPLTFRQWAPGDRLERGVWNIPVPAEGDEIAPDTIVSPLVGYDEAGYRLGYGGGFYDRTLAAMREKPLAIGVGFTLSRLPTIYPQWHDVPMDRIIVEEVA